MDTDLSLRQSHLRQSVSSVGNFCRAYLSEVFVRATIATLRRNRSKPLDRPHDVATTLSSAQITRTTSITQLLQCQNVGDQPVRGERQPLPKINSRTRLHHMVPPSVRSVAVKALAPVPASYQPIDVEIKSRASSAHQFVPAWTFAKEQTYTRTFGNPPTRTLSAHPSGISSIRPG